MTQFKIKQFWKKHLICLISLVFYINCFKKYIHNQILYLKLIVFQTNVIERVGGSDLSQFIRNGIKRIVTDDLAMQFSWTGTKNKPKIREYFFISIIRGLYFILLFISKYLLLLLYFIDICHVKFVNVDDSKIYTILQQHFVHAKDRVEKRLKKVKEVNT